MIQYLDEIEDLFYVAPLIAEQLRRAIQRVLFLLGSISLQIAGIVLALKHPPLALAIATLLMVGLLFRAVVIPGPQALAAS